MTGDEPLKPSRRPSDTASDMTTIRTTCPRCGEVDMGPEAILLSVVQGGIEGTYRFECPQCMENVEKRADRKIVALLVSAGVDVDASQAGEPAQSELFDDDEIASLERRPEGPPFTIDDVIRFHFQLQDERFVEQILSS
jgi:predicted RNA-binding Zn-ribbon protein involved in translation (DUF1610 family)